MTEESDSITLKELYEKVDQSVNDFAASFTSLLPVSDLTHVSKMIILNDIISLKEKAKMSINTYVMDNQNKEKENAESNKENK